MLRKNILDAYLFNKCGWKVEWKYTILRATNKPDVAVNRGRILGRNWDKSFKSFPPCYSQPPHDFSPPPPLIKSGLKLICNVQTVNANLKSENSQEFSKKPQRNCTFMNSASVKHAPKWTPPSLSYSSLLFSEPLSDTRKRNVQPGQEFASLQNLIRGTVPSQPLQVNPVPSQPLQVNPLPPQPLQVNAVPSQPFPVTPATRSRGLIEPLFNTAGMVARKDHRAKIHRGKSRIQILSFFL
jgi:hypothetical protein